MFERVHIVRCIEPVLFRKLCHTRNVDYNYLKAGKDQRKTGILFVFITTVHSISNLNTGRSSCFYYLNNGWVDGLLEIGHLTDVCRSGSTSLPVKQKIQVYDNEDRFHIALFSTSLPVKQKIQVYDNEDHFYIALFSTSLPVKQNIQVYDYEDHLFSPPEQTHCAFVECDSK